MIAATGCAGFGIVIFGKPPGLDQAQAVTLDPRGQTGLASPGQAIGDHVIDNQPNRPAPIASAIKFGGIWVMARHQVPGLIDQPANPGPGIGAKTAKSPPTEALWTRASAARSKQRY